MENAGGAQVPFPVIQAINKSLSYRHRDKVGAQSKAYARQTLLAIVGVTCDDDDAPITNDNDDYQSSSKSIYSHAVFLGSNASSLLNLLAQKYMDSGLITNQDEIVIAEHNHDANIIPWLALAKRTGAKVRWWKCINHPSAVNSNQSDYTSTSSTSFESNQSIQSLTEVLTPSTKIVAMAHASNVLGQLYDIQSIALHIKSVTSRKARVIVDGVAAVPHRFTNLRESCVDWYVISCHKLFGPHLGALFGRFDAIEDIQNNLESSQVHTLAKNAMYKNETIPENRNVDIEGWYKQWEIGT